MSSSLFSEDDPPMTHAPRKKTVLYSSKRSKIQDHIIMAHYLPEVSHFFGDVIKTCTKNKCGSHFKILEFLVLGIHAIRSLVNHLIVIVFGQVQSY